MTGEKKAERVKCCNCFRIKFPQFTIVGSNKDCHVKILLAINDPRTSFLGEIQDILPSLEASKRSFKVNRYGISSTIHPLHLLHRNKNKLLKSVAYPKVAFY